MKKSDFNKLRAMLKNESELWIFNYNPHVMIIAPGRFALAYPVETYNSFIAGTPATPEKIAPGTGFYIAAGGRGKKAWRNVENIPADKFNNCALYALRKHKKRVA